eukprot:TRINITY_DN9033_c0_g1_i1.p1 TRINITY_DN9033_c0_g1~~TRINITY_DN9033_c0_g1_i1.p1  ORF type:complete len:425 (+),score=54.09 TRINITY_DN9033_c0_g1_i1:380-1654(+)
MGEWIVGAVTNVVGSIAINLGTNLLKLGHNERDKAADTSFAGEKEVSKKPITHFQSWRIGAMVFALGNIINFISFGYAAQSLLAALGSVQFVSNVGFAYWVLGESVNYSVILATIFIVVGNIFFVSFGNHQSLIYTPQQLLAKYTNFPYLVYCAFLALVVFSLHTIYNRGRELVARKEEHAATYWKTLIPFSYAVVSGAVGTHSVLFAKSLSILLRLTMSGDSQLDGWFTYLILLLFLFTASFWMARLNDGLSMFDAILIVPMFQIAWTFFSIFTGFIYFQEYQVFDGLRASMFAIGISFLFVGMSLLAPETPKGHDGRIIANEADYTPLICKAEEEHCTYSFQHWDGKSFAQHMANDAMLVLSKAKAAYTRTFGLGQDQLPASSVFAMPMLPSSRMRWRYVPLDCHWLEVRAEDDELNSPAAV